MGAPPPWIPVLPTPVGLGFASVLSPTRGGVVNAGYSLHLLVLWGDTPHSPRQGASPPWTPVLPTPVGLGSASVLSPTRGGVVNAGYSLHLLVLWGDTPHSPRQGACAPWTPVLPTIVGLGLPAF